MFSLRASLCAQEGKDVRLCDWGAKDIDVLNTLQLLTAKPVVYLVNLSEADYLRKKNKWLAKIAEWVKVRARAALHELQSCVSSWLVMQWRCC